jgi:hypothetical protein
MCTRRIIRPPDLKTVNKELRLAEDLNRRIGQDKLAIRDPSGNAGKVTPIRGDQQAAVLR